MESEWDDLRDDEEETAEEHFVYRPRSPDQCAREEGFTFWD